MPSCRRTSPFMTTYIPCPTGRNACEGIILSGNTHLNILSLIHDFFNLLGKRFEEDLQFFMVVGLSGRTVLLIAEVHSSQVVI